MHRNVLIQLKVEMVVLPAAPQAESMWKKIGFRKPSKKMV